MFSVLGALKPVHMAIRFHPALQVMMPGALAQQAVAITTEKSG